MKAQSWFIKLKTRFSPLGQSLVEFALVLPVMLLLLVGVMEFARIFQAWLTVENAARTAVRYAVTGQYDTDYCAVFVGTEAAENNGRPVLDDCIIRRPGEVQVLENLVDAYGDPIYGAEDAGGPTKLCQALFRLPDDTSSSKPVAQPSCLATTGTSPALTLVWNPDATWADVTAAMQDHARLPSIKDEANRGATGISFSALNALSFNQDLADIGDYKVTVCSGRPRSDGNSYFIFGEDGDTTDTDEYCSWRNFGGWSVAPAEDAGGPDNFVYVVVTFNHPLITPIKGLWPFVRLQSSRQMVVESFRAARVLGLPPAIMPDTPTPSMTPTATVTASTTPSPTPEAPDCDDLALGWVGLGVTDWDHVTFGVYNDSPQWDFRMVELDFSWPDYDVGRIEYIDMGGSRIEDDDYYNSPIHLDETDFNGGTNYARTVGYGGTYKDLRFDMQYDPVAASTNSQYGLTLLMEVPDGQYAGFQCVLDLPPLGACDDLIVSGEHHFYEAGQYPSSYYEDDLYAPTVTNIGGNLAWLSGLTLYWPDAGEPFSEQVHRPDMSSPPYVSEAYMSSEGDWKRVISYADDSTSPWEETWSSSHSYRSLYPGDPHWFSYDFQNQQTLDLRQLGMPLSPEQTRLTESTLWNQNPSTTSDDLNHNFLHPDQFSTTTEWTMGDGSICEVPLGDGAQKGPYIRLNLPSSMGGPLPGIGGDYWMRPGHMVAEWGVPVNTTGVTVTNELVVDLTAFDRDYATYPSEPANGTGIREIAIWIEGPENEALYRGDRYNLLLDDAQDWLYDNRMVQDDVSYRYTLDLSEGEWPNGSPVVPGTHYLYIRATDSDDLNFNYARLYTLLVVPFEVELNAECDEIVAGDQLNFLQTDADYGYRSLFTDWVTNTNASLPITIYSAEVSWPQGNNEREGMSRYGSVYIDDLYRWDETGRDYEYHRGNGYTDPWLADSGWRDPITRRQVQADDRSFFSDEYQGTYYVDIGEILNIPFNPWYPSNRMAPYSYYTSRSYQNYFYSSRITSNWIAYSLGGNIVHPSQFEVNLDFDFAGGLTGGCPVIFDNGPEGPAIQLLSPAPNRSNPNLSASYASPWYIRPTVVAPESSIPSAGNCLYDYVSIEAEAYDLDLGGPDGNGIQEMAYWLVGPNSYEGYRNLLIPSGRPTNWMADWAYDNFSPYCPLGQSGGIDVAGTTTLGNTSTSANYLRTFRVDMLEDGVVQDLYFYFEENSNNTPVSLGLYNSNANGQPSGLVWSTQTTPPDEPGWLSLPVNVSLPAGTYWIGYKAASPITFRYFNDDGTYCREHWYYTSAGGYPLPGTFPISGASLTNHCASAYITYSRSHAYAGNSVDLSGSENSYFENYFYTSRAMVNENGTIDSVNLYLTRGNPSGGSLRVGIYDSTAGSMPGNLLWSTVVVPPDEVGWHQVDVSPGLNVNAGLYWIAYYANDSDMRIRIRGSSTECTVGSVRDTSYKSETDFSSLPGTFPGSVQVDDWCPAVYATYTRSTDCGGLVIPDGRWPNGYPIVNGRYYLYARALDTDDQNEFNGEKLQSLYTLLVSSFEICGGEEPNPTPTPTHTPTATYTPSMTPTPSRTSTPTITYTPSRTATYTRTPTPSNTPTTTPTGSPTLTGTPTYTPSPTGSPSPTSTPSPFPTGSAD